jgi:hypothetical protein
MKHRMEAEFMFMDGPKTANPAAAALAALGYEVEVMDWKDDDENGELITPTVWLIAGCMSELDNHEFFHQMSDLATGLDGEILQAGYRGEHPIKETVEAHNRKCAEIAAAKAEAAANGPEPC